ncbi:chlorite dismutase family protein [Amnibacterium sp. CER49]|uniref:hydrogen peroxide-dependent heme synthase n=1 Tax=Amnibacterium sp. CER49 TaxID=3039161 RepID=UPI002448A760|nr:hydrogen peroxide-dependent heme synthase [Amnibacterium sp. CER49]MDH2443578.1 chlorite dismutase family protein [Amnibacterium sp. CER49]
MTEAGYTLWAVLRRDPARPSSGTDTAGLAALLGTLAEEGVTTRGVYDVSGLRADADLMFWLHGDDPAALQAAHRRIRRTEPIAGMLPVWNAMAVHRDAEFSRTHVPGFLRGERPRDWLSVYPFVRSYDWYVLPDEDRARMLADHGRRGAAYKSVIANTVAAFALGDYEWILPMESDSLTDLVDMMRDLRATEARLHVREEVPFFTGRRIDVAEIAEVLS